MPIFKKYHFLVLVCCSYISGCTGKEVHWTDNAILHDGRILEVKRTTEFASYLWRVIDMVEPQQHSLVAINPDSGQKVTWSDDGRIEAVMLDFVDKSAYLAVSGRVFSNIEKYGCPEIPYVYLKYNEQTSKWKPIRNSDIPKELHFTNLSDRYYQWMGEDFVYKDQYLSNKDQRQVFKELSMDRNSNALSRSNQSYFPHKIPSSFDEWENKDKENFKNERDKNDCRPTFPEPIDAINPKSPIPLSQNVKLEILENKEYDPVMQIDNDDSAGPSKFTQLTWDVERHKACDLLFKPVVNRGYSQNQIWQTFVNDPTGTKFISNSDSNLICDSNAIWLEDYSAEKGKVVIVKASVSGDVIYRVSFDKPDESLGYSGFILGPTLKSQDGYVYFDWWTAESENKYWKVKHSMKLKFHEPVT